MVVTEFLGIILEALGFGILVETKVTDADRVSAAAVIEQCYVGQPLQGEPREWSQITAEVLNNDQAERSTNLHTFLDITGPAELYNVLFILGQKKR